MIKRIFQRLPTEEESLEIKSKCAQSLFWFIFKTKSNRFCIQVAYHTLNINRMVKSVEEYRGRVRGENLKN